jgi:probable rRNA maturation factor
MIDVQIQGRIPTVLLNEDAVAAIRAAVKAIKKPSHGAISVAFISADEMRALNRTWRKKNKTTDVLSFAAESGFPLPKSEDQPIGDLFLDAAFIREEAKERKISYREELIRNLVHGTLHLYGYDHATPEEEKVMFGIQEKVVHSCGKVL